MENEIRTRLVFDKLEHIDSLYVLFQQHTEIFYQMVQFINSRFFIQEGVQMETFYRAFHRPEEYKSQINDIDNNTYYFNSYYIDKYNEKSLKNYGPGFYLLEHISPNVNSLLLYQIHLKYNEKMYKIAKLPTRINELLMVVEFKEMFQNKITEILNITDKEYNRLFDARHFFGLFYAYFRSIGVKFVLFYSDVYETWIHVYIDDTYQPAIPFSILHTVSEETVTAY